MGKKDVERVWVVKDLPTFLRTIAAQLEGRPPDEPQDGPDVLHLIIVKDIDGKPVIWKLKEYQRVEDFYNSAIEY